MPTTLVTGASEGIGAAICAHLRTLGHVVIGISRRPPTEFDGPFYAADLADERTACEMLSKIVADHSVDHLVCNAGLSERCTLEKIDLAGWRAMAAINIEAVIQCVQAVVPGMKARGYGRIVTIGSKAMQGRERTSTYAASKAAVEALSKSWALELAPHGITVNIVAPGAIDTGMFARNNNGSPALQAFVDAIPLRRTGRAEEVAAAVGYFLTDGAAYTTGQTLYVTGGWGLQHDPPMPRAAAAQD